MYQSLDSMDEIRVMIVQDAIFLPDASNIRISLKYFQIISTNSNCNSLQVNVAELKILKLVGNVALVKVLTGNRYQ